MASGAFVALEGNQLMTYNLLTAKEESRIGVTKKKNGRVELSGSDGQTIFRKI